MRVGLVIFGKSPEARLSLRNFAVFGWLPILRKSKF